MISDAGTRRDQENGKPRANGDAKRGRAKQTAQKRMGVSVWHAMVMRGDKDEGWRERERERGWRREEVVEEKREGRGKKERGKEGKSERARYSKMLCGTRNAAAEPTTLLALSLSHHAPMARAGSAVFFLSFNFNTSRVFFSCMLHSPLSTADRLTWMFAVTLM